MALDEAVVYLCPMNQGTHHDYRQSRLPVPAAYEAVFSYFYHAANNTTTAVTKTLLPTYQTIMVFVFGGKGILHSAQHAQLEVEQCMVLGPVKQAFEYTLPAGTSILVANFKDDAFYRFFGCATMTGHPDTLVEDNCFTALWESLQQLSAPEAQVAHILTFCEPYLQDRHLLSAHLANFEDENLNPVKAIADATGQSERNIQLHQKKQFGYSVKERHRYQRFLKAVQMVQQQTAAGASIDWFDLIDACGYYDQSQLIHDFRHYLRLSPKQYLKFQEDICLPKI